MKDIKGYEGLYAVTEDGRVWSYPRGNGMNPNGKFLKPNLSGRYPYVTFVQLGQKKQKTIHRLVAEAYLPNPNNMPQVNHIDGDKTNNCVGNLEWCDASHNMRHAHDNNLVKLNPKSAEEVRKAGFARRLLSFKDAADIRELYAVGNMTQKEIGEEYGVAKSVIQMICANKTYIVEAVV